MSITPLPTAPAVTDTTSEFNTKAFNWVAALSTFTTEANAQAVAVDADATAAAASASDALAAASTALATVGAVAWVSGTTYATGAAVYSPLNKQTYRRNSAGAGTTDPSLDAVNWTQVRLDPIDATQAEMEAGTETAVRSMSPLRVKQAIPAPRTKIWTAITATGTYTVPTGVTSIRAYAFGKGGNGDTGGAGGGGGGCAYGDIAVTAGQTVTITISGGVATVAYGGTTLLTANAGGNGNAGGTGGSGGTATNHASVTNGGAYSGGSGGASWGGGGSSGSPLGNGYAGGTSAPYAGGGAGIGGSGSSYGAGGGAGGAAVDGSGGGSGGPASAYGFATGKSRTFESRFTDPILAHCDAPGGSFVQSNYYSHSAGPGGGAGSYANTQYGGAGGDFGGGAGATNVNGPTYGGSGGFGGGGGAGRGTGGQTGFGGAGGRGGGGGGGNTAGGTGGAAIVLIYA